MGHRTSAVPASAVVTKPPRICCKHGFANARPLPLSGFDSARTLARIGTKYGPGRQTKGR
jgi:hypothetical protein